MRRSVPSQPVQAVATARPLWMDLRAPVRTPLLPEAGEAGGAEFGVEAEVVGVVEGAGLEHEGAGLADADLDGVAVADEGLEVLGDGLGGRVDLGEAEGLLEDTGRHEVEHVLDEGDLVGEACSRIRRRAARFSGGAWVSMRSRTAGISTGLM